MNEDHGACIVVESLSVYKLFAILFLSRVGIVDVRHPNAVEVEARRAGQTWGSDKSGALSPPSTWRVLALIQYVSSHNSIVLYDNLVHTSETAHRAVCFVACRREGSRPGPDYSAMDAFECPQLTPELHTKLCLKVAQLTKVVRK